MMRNCGLYHRLFIFSALSLIACPAVYSQTDTLSAPISDSATSSINRKDNHSLYAGAGAGNNMIYLGTSISNNQPFYSGSITYGFRNSFFLSASATHLSNTDPYVAFYAVAANYSKAINSWFDISADIGGYNTASSLHDTLFSDFGYVNLTTGFDWKLIYTRLAFSGLRASENAFYFMISNSRYFETPSFFKGKGQVSFDPDIDLLFGKMITIESDTITKNYGKSPPFNHTKKNPDQISENYSEKFGLLDLEFSIPVTFSYKNLSIEAETIYLLPFYSYPGYPTQQGFYFYLNIFYKIF